MLMRDISAVCLCACVHVCVQILKSTGRCVTVCEPNSIYVLGAKYGKFGDSSQLRQLTRDMIRWECRPYTTMQPPPLGYFLKLTAHCLAVLPILK